MKKVNCCTAKAWGWVLHCLLTISLRFSTWILWSGWVRCHALCSLQHHQTAVPWLQPCRGGSSPDHTSSLPLFPVLSHITLMEHIPKANRLFIYFFLSSVSSTSESFYCASRIVLVLWDILQYSGTILHFQCFITSILTNHTCLHHIVHGCSYCLPHGLPGIHCRRCFIFFLKFQSSSKSFLYFLIFIYFY